MSARYVKTILQREGKLYSYKLWFTFKKRKNLEQVLNKDKIKFAY